MTRLGILGGTFDPIHYGHLAAAEEAAWACQLDRVLFIPAREPPHKHAEPVTPVEHRLEMVRRAIEGNQRLELSTIELEREGPSYTVDTLTELAHRYPDSELRFIIGMDSLAELPLWRDPAGVIQRAKVLAVHRAGTPVVDLDRLAREIPALRSRVTIATMPGLAISSTELRERVHDGRSIRYLVPDGVRQYIEAHGLYRASTV